MRVLALACSVVAVFAFAAEPDAGVASRQLFHAARAIAPESGQVTSPAWLLIEGSRIVSLGTTRPPGDARLVELGALTLVPGFIDAHAHLLHVEKPHEDSIVNEAISLSEADRALRGAWLAGQVLRGGFTTVRDLGNSGRGADVSLRRAIASGWVMGPTIIASTRALAPPLGQFGRLAATHLAVASQEYAIVRTPDEATAAVADALAEGADCIKVIVDSGKGRELDQPTLEAIVARAHRAGVKVAAHCVTSEAAERAVAAGVDSIEHGYQLNDATLAMMAKRRIALVPTDYPGSFYELFAPDGPAEERAKVLTSFVEFRERSKKRLQRAVANKVAIVYGSDTYVETPLRDRGREMALVFEAYADAGLSPLEVLRSATSTAAKHLGLPGGRLEPGAPADLVAIEGNPLDDVKALGRVRLVVRQGKAL